MEIDGLSRAVESALQSLTRPSQYLHPNPADSETGPLSRSLLLIGSESDDSMYDNPGFHRTYRLLEQTPDHYVEQFIHPEMDYFQMTRELEVAPWALESRRSIFSFPIWVCYLSWPGAWMSMQRLLDQLNGYDQFEESAPMIVLMTPPSFPFSESTAEYVDATLPQTAVPHDLEDLNTLTEQLLQENTIPESVLSDHNRTDPPREHEVDPHHATPLPPLQTHSPNRCWMGNIESFDQNHTLQKTTWPTFSYPSPETTIQILEEVIDSSGVQCLELGGISSMKDTDNGLWQLEFLERFHAKWGNRPICYQLDNPRPDHPVWEYEHLLERYNHRPLQVHLGSPDDRFIDHAHSEQIEHWLTHFLSCGGPKMQFTADVDGTSETVSRIRQLCKQLRSINNRYIDGKAQLRVFLQPRLSDPSRWKTPNELLQVTEQLQKTFENDLIQIKLDLPDHYESMLEMIAV